MATIWAKWFQPTTPHPVSIKSILTLSFHLPLCLSSDMYHSRFLTLILMHLLSLPCVIPGLRASTSCTQISCEQNYLNFQHYSIYFKYKYSSIQKPMNHWKNLCIVHGSQRNIHKTEGRISENCFRFFYKETFFIHDFKRQELSCFL
jgi:hypothetical protein